MRIASLVGLVTILVACDTLPEVDHSLIENENQLPKNEIATYALQESTVKLEEGSEKNAKVKITPGRRDHQKVRIALIDAGDFWVKTDVAIVKFENTEIPKEIVVKVEDNRKEIFEKSGAIIVSAIKSGFLPFTVSGEPRLPVIVNISRSIPAAERSAFRVVLPDPPIQIDIDSLPPDAIPVANLRSVDAGAYYYYAACRTAVLSFKFRSNRYQHTIKISDPNFLQRVRMPYNGKIEMHSQCGVSVTGKLSDDNATRNLELIEALLVQGKSIKEALEAAKKTE